MLLAALLLASVARAAEEPAPPVQPGYADAVARYEAGDFPVAREAFLALARMGIRDAHYNLGVMAMKGEGLAANPGLAWGWFTTAKQLGAAVPDDVLSRLDSKLGEADRLVGKQVVEQYGAEALGKQLAATYAQCAAWIAAPGGMRAGMTAPVMTPRSEKTLGQFYPMKLMQAGQQAMVGLDAFVDLDGHVKNARHEFTTPPVGTGGLELSAQAMFERIAYAPATVNGRPAAVRYMYSVTFIMGNSSFWNPANLEAVKAAARRNDPGAQFSVALLASMNERFRNMARVELAEVPALMASAALGGNVHAQYRIARDCAAAQEEPLHRLGREWAAQVARQGHPRAQLEEALESIRTGGAAKERARLLRLLQVEDDYVRRKAALALATVLPRESRAPEEALRVAQQLGERYACPKAGAAPSEARVPCGPGERAPAVLDPELDIVLAAALAANNRMPEALEAMRRAILKENKLRWDASVPERLLAAYEQGSEPDYREVYLSWSDEEMRSRGVVLAK
ncbi:MAG: energy transducer TonB [Steroidobacteraceae bacterium]